MTYRTSLWIKLGYDYLSIYLIDYGALHKFFLRIFYSDNQD